MRNKPVGRFLFTVTVCFLWCSGAPADDLPIISGVDAQPLGVQVGQVMEALEFRGSPLPEETNRALAAALAMEDDAELVRARCRRHSIRTACSASRSTPNRASRSLRALRSPNSSSRGGGRFLIKVHNQAGVTPPA